MSGHNSNDAERYTSTPETPAGVILVNSYREENAPSWSKKNEDDDCSSKPSGRLQSDNVYLKNGGGNLNIGSWNVRTLYMQGKFDNLIKESKEMKMDILGVSEHRWSGEGTVKGIDHTFIYSGGDSHKHGVGILLKSNIAQCVMGTWNMSPRNMLIKLRAKPMNIAIIQTYAPTTEYPDEDMEIYYEEIQKMISNVKSTEILIIMGDFNAKIGKGKENDTVGNFGLGERNERGDRLIQFCIENDLIVANTFYEKPKRKLYTWKSPGDLTRNQIDYILIKKRFRNCIKTCQTRPGADINSDHNPITAKLKIKLKRLKKPQKSTDIDIGRLMSSEAMQEKYRITVANKYNVLTEETEEQYEEANTTGKIEIKWNNLKESILHGNKDIPKHVKRANKGWMTQEILNLMSERKKLKNKQGYDILEKKIQHECKKAKDAWLNHHCRLVEISGLNDKEAHEQIRLISGKKRKQNSSNCVKDRNGKILMETEEVKDRWCEYIGELFNDDRPQAPMPSNNDGPPILSCEIENALKKMKDGKAKGEDGVTTEMLKILEGMATEKLKDLFNDIYNAGYIPKELAQSVYITLPKKSSAVECGDFRTISLMPHVTKLLLKIILERIQSKIDKEVGDVQFGFRKNTGTREAIFCLNNVTQKYIEKQKKIYACFIDYAKAFDRVHHSEIIQCLERVGIDGKDIRLITNLYWHQKAAIRIQGEVSEYTSIKRGVRQGCVLSPYLFNIYTEFIFRQTELYDGINVGGRNINNFRYADDTVLLTENEEALQKLVNDVNINSEAMGLDMNVSKTKVMVMAKDPNVPTDIAIKGRKLESVKTFKYLGQRITNNGKSEDEVKTRIAIARSRFGDLRNILTSKQTQPSTKLRVLKCYVHSALLYGSETWTMNKNIEKRIEAFEMWTFRRMAKISWTEKKTNEEVCDIMNIEPNLLKTIKTRKVKYFGHTKRHISIQNHILEGCVEGRRTRGRPARIWMDDIKSWTGLTAAECNNRATDRHAWQEISRRPLKR